MTDDRRCRARERPRSVPPARPDGSPPGAPLREPHPSSPVITGRERTSSLESWWTYEGTPRPLDPLQESGPPLWFGARSASALDRAARLGDGWIGAGSARINDCAAALATLRRCLNDAGRPERTFQLAKRVYVHVTPPGKDGTTVGPRLRDWFEHHYGRAALADDVVLTGSPDACVDHVGRLGALGVGTVILHPVLDHLEQLEVLADGVVSQLR